MLAHASARDWTVPKERVFADDGFSGATLDRPALEALRDAVAAGAVETVLAWSVDRLSRNFAHQMLLQEEFARHGARIVFVQEPDDATPQGMLLRQMLSVISEYERTQIAERSRRGKIHRARQGSLNMISRPPYGYRLIRKTETCGARLEIDAGEAAVVRRIYDLYAREGLKMNAVSQVVQQNVEAGLEQRLPACPQKREKRPLVRRELVQTAIQCVVGDNAHRAVQQVPQGAVLVPVPVQPPLAARVDQLRCGSARSR